MNILILNGSPRRNGVLAQLLGEIAKNIPSQNSVEIINVYDLAVKPCIACMACRTKGVCSLPNDDAQLIADKINACDVLIVGTPTHWGNASSALLTLFGRLVYVMATDNDSLIPKGLQKGKKAILVATCTTPYPFNILYKQSRGAIKAMREILRWSGFKIIGTLEKGGTRKHPELTNGEKRKCARLAKNLLYK